MGGLNPPAPPSPPVIRFSTLGTNLLLAAKGRAQSREVVLIGEGVLTSFLTQT